jgi:hypothetical protein
MVRPAHASGKFEEVIRPGPYCLQIAHRPPAVRRWPSQIMLPINASQRGAEPGRRKAGL